MHFRLNLIHLSFICIILTSCASKNTDLLQDEEFTLKSNDSLIDLEIIQNDESVFYRFENEILILSNILNHGEPFPKQVELIEKNDSFYIPQIGRGFTKVHSLEMGDLSYPLIPAVPYRINNGVLEHTLFSHKFVINGDLLTCLDTTFLHAESHVTFQGGSKTSCYARGENFVHFSTFEHLTSSSIPLNFLVNTAIELRLKNNDCPTSDRKYKGKLMYIHETKTNQSDYFSSNFVFIESQ